MWNAKQKLEAPQTWSSATKQPVFRTVQHENGGNRTTLITTSIVPPQKKTDLNHCASITLSAAVAQSMWVENKGIQQQWR